MVLWEITVATAYFLGLKRTYRLALKLQRRVIGPRHPKIRQFLHRRTRSAFSIALSVHRKIQERDIEVGRNIGNWVLRWLDRMKPSAEIRPALPGRPPTRNNLPKHITSPGQASRIPGGSVKNTDSGSSGQLFVTSGNIWPKSFPTISMMLQRAKPSCMSSQYRHLHNYAPCAASSEGIFRKDISQWMLQN